MPILTRQALSPTETVIMQAVWSYGEPMTVRQVHTVLLFRGLAYTTIMTTMVRLADKGFLTRSADRQGQGEAYRYQPALSRGELLAACIEQLCASPDADRGDWA